MDVYNISNLLAIIGALVVLVNILTEVIKKVTWDRLPTNIVALILSEGLTLAAAARGAYRAYALSSYIKRKYKGKIYGLIVDELHEYSNKSGQGEAMAELYGTAKKVVGMTATLINGYSSGIFHLLYRICPAQMRKDNKRYENPSKFDAEYGVIQNTYVEQEPAWPWRARSTAVW